MFAKFCQDALYHILRHPRSIHIAGLHWGLGTGMGWGVVGMGGDGWEWVLGIIVVAGLATEDTFFTFRLHFGSILDVF